jgi:beta-glucosidase-like glycosyl hydrolase
MRVGVQVNGIPSCADGFIQNTILRGEWGFNGYTTSVS